MIDQLKKEVEKFQTLQDEFSDYGAGDTEPNWLFDSRLAKVIKGEKLNPVLDWDLYGDMPGVDKVMNVLTAQMLKIEEIVRNARIADRSDIIKLLSEYSESVDEMEWMNNW